MATPTTADTDIPTLPIKNIIITRRRRRIIAPMQSLTATTRTVGIITAMNPIIITNAVTTSTVMDTSVYVLLFH